MVALENIKHRISNIPRYLRYTMKRKKNAPFHWTATQKNIQQKRNLFEQQLAFKEGESQKKGAIDVLCERLEAKPKMTANDKILFKEYCLSPENINVGEVNIEALNLDSENLNLPLKDPLQGAIQRINAAGDILNELNDFVLKTSQMDLVLDQKKLYKKKEAYLEQKFTEARALLEEAREIAAPVTKFTARAVLVIADQTDQSLNDLYKEIDDTVNYSIDMARGNIAKAINKIRQNKNVNISNALQKLRGSSSTFNLTLLGNYGTALEEQLQRRQRRARVATASSPRVVQNWRGGKTRRRK